MKNNIDSLQGRLDQVALASLFGTFHAQRESGTLHVSSKGLSKRVHFETGEIVFANSDADAERFGEFLIREGTIQRSDFELVYQATKKTRTRLGQALVEMGYLSPEQMQTRVIQQIEAIIYSLFDWTTGQYRSERIDKPVDDDLRLSLSTSNLILEAGRRTQNLAAIHCGLGGLEAVMHFSVEPSLIYQQIQLKPEEAFLLSRVDGKSKVSQIIAISPLGEEATLRCLFGLVSAGVLAPEHGQIVPSTAHWQTEEEHFQLTERLHPDCAQEPFFPDVDTELNDVFKRITSVDEVLPDPVGCLHDNAIMIAEPPYLTMESAIESTQTLSSRSVSSPSKLDVGSRLRAAATRYEEGRRFFNEKLYYEAAQVLRDAVRLDPSKAIYHRLLAKSLVKNPKWRRQAAKHFEHAIELEPFHFESYLGLGLIYESSGMIARAKKYFEKVLTLEPDNKLAARKLNRKRTSSENWKELFRLA